MRHLTSNDIIKAYYQMFTSRLKDDGIHFYASPAAFYKERIVFGTLTPDPFMLASRGASVSSRLKAIRCLEIRCYERLARHSLKNWRRKPEHLLPVTMAFIEPQGARAANKRGLDLGDLPHLHSMTYFRTRASALTFGAALADGSFNESLSRDRLLKSAMYEFYDRRKGSILNLFSYCAKFDVPQQAKAPASDELIMHLPPTTR